jgi:hypothetical protein
MRQKFKIQAALSYLLRYLIYTLPVNYKIMNLNIRIRIIIRFKIQPHRAQHIFKNRKNRINLNTLISTVVMNLKMNKYKL